MKFIGRIFCLSALMLMPLAAFAQQKKESIEIDYNNPRTYVVGGVKVEGNRAFGDNQIIQQSGLHRGWRLPFPVTICPQS